MIMHCAQPTYGLLLGGHVPLSPAAGFVVFLAGSTSLLLDSEGPLALAFSVLCCCFSSFNRCSGSEATAPGAGDSSSECGLAGTELAIFDELWPLRLAQRLQETLVKGLSLPRGHGQVEVGLVALEDVLQGGLAESTSYCLSIMLFSQCFPLSASNTCLRPSGPRAPVLSVYLPGKYPATCR